MSGMEMMLARMMGMSADEMKHKAETITGAITESVDLMRRLEARLIDIQERLERIENANKEIPANGDKLPVQHRARGSGNNSKRSASGKPDISL